MKRLFSIFSWLLLTVTAVVIFAIATGQQSSGGFLFRQRERKASLARNAFAGFPLNIPRTIDFEPDDSPFSQLSPREQLFQQRDWVLYAILSDSGMSADALSRTVFDVAAVRHGYLKHVARLEYGLTRSCVIGESTVIALIPQCPDVEKLDHLGHIFDEARKNLGTAPAELIIFEYSLATKDQATITHRPNAPGQNFLTSASGYRESLVSNIAELANFMNDADDLLFAQDQANGLRVGGRKFAATKYRNITVEDIAAIWQAEAKIQTDLRDFSARWDERVKNFNLTAKRYASRQEVDRAFESEIQRPHDAEQATLRLVNGSGFSLDPNYDYKGLAQALGKHTLVELLGPSDLAEDFKAVLLTAARDVTSSQRANPNEPEALSKPISVSSLLQAAGVAESALSKAIAALRGEEGQGSSLASNDLLLQSRRKATTSKRTVLPAQTLDFSNLFDPLQVLPKTPSGAVKADPVPFLRLVEQLKQAGADDNLAAKVLAKALQSLNEHYQFQAARYDGPLDGTEVGMVLFYTDLLAKLWTLDYLNSTPTAAVSEFDPMTRIILPVIYRAELIKLPNTRLWFGPEDNGYQIDDGNCL